jgi:hypothetical protein
MQHALWKISLFAISGISRKSLIPSASKMMRATRENWALLVGMLMLMMANGLLVTLLGVRGVAIGMSPSATGLMQACSPLGALACAPVRLC